MAVPTPPQTTSFFLVSRDTKLTDAQSRPYAFVSEKPAVATMETLERVDNIVAINGPAFVKLLDMPVDSNKSIQSDLFIVPTGAVKDYMTRILPEQKLFLTIFHHLHFLATLVGKKIAPLSGSFIERYNGLSELLAKEFASQALFGVPSRDLQTYFNTIQTTIVGSNSRREKSFMDIVEMIQGDPKAILSYFKSAQSLPPINMNETESYTGTETVRGFNSASLQTFNNTASTITIPETEDVTAAAEITEDKADDTASFMPNAISLVTSGNGKNTGAGTGLFPLSENGKSFVTNESLRAPTTPAVTPAALNLQPNASNTESSNAESSAASASTASNAESSVASSTASNIESIAAPSASNTESASAESNDSAIAHTANLPAPMAAMPPIPPVTRKRANKSKKVSMTEQAEEIIYNPKKVPGENFLKATLVPHKQSNRTLKKKNASNRVKPVRHSMYGYIPSSRPNSTLRGKRMVFSNNSESVTSNKTSRNKKSRKNGNK